MLVSNVESDLEGLTETEYFVDVSCDTSLEASVVENLSEDTLVLESVDVELSAAFDVLCTAENWYDVEITFVEDAILVDIVLGLGASDPVLEVLDIVERSDALPETVDVPDTEAVLVKSFENDESTLRQRVITPDAAGVGSKIVTMREVLVTPTNFEESVSNEILIDLV